jgi:putative transposase
MYALNRSGNVGSRDDSYDNALAESFIGLFKTELVSNRGPFRGLDDLELATAAELEQRFADDHDHGPLGPVEADRPALLGARRPASGEDGNPMT